MNTETIRAATIIEQRPSGRHYKRWSVRLTFGEWCGLVGYTLHVGGLDGLWFGNDENAAIIAFDRAATTE